VIQAAAREISMLRDLLEVPSPTGSEEQVARCAALQMEALGFTVERDAVGNVLGTWGTGSREICLVGHVDTVPGEIPVRVEGGRIHGRGAVDAKGAFATFIHAVARQPRSGDTRFVVIGAVEEEGSSRGARHLVARASPQALIIGEPSGWDAVVVGYKGSQCLRYRVEQPVAHTAGPVPTAGEHLVAFYRELQDWCDAANGAKSLFHRIDPRIRGMETRSDGLTETGTLSLGLRLPPAFDLAGLTERLRGWAKEGTLEFDPPEAPVRTDKGSLLVRSLLAGIRAAGGTPRFKVKTGTSDMNILAPAWGCSAAAYGPGESLLDHTPQESLSIDEYLRAIDVLSAALSRLGGAA
jgi:LysW-gamma-L-lysine carboxypeptidase